MLKKIAVGVAGAVALFVGIGLVLPATARVERSTVIDAPPAMVFTVLNGFRQFQKWSPWADIDPNATTTYEGPSIGVGSKMSWAGNSDVGTGSQEIVESTPYDALKLRLTFGDFPGQFHASYLLAPEGSGTKLTWAFDADYGGSIIGRYFGLMADSMVGADYEKGLGRLKALVEVMPKGDFAGLEIEAVETHDDPILFMSIHSADNANAVGVGLGVAYSRLSGYMSAQKIRQVAPPVAIFRGRRGDVLQIDAAIPVDRAEATPASPLQLGRLPAGQAVKAVYRGSLDGLAAARQKVSAYVAAAGLEAAGPLWQRYVSDPGTTPPADLLTEIYFPVK